MESKDAKDVPLSESNVSMKLAMIQRRCVELLDEGNLELSLEDAVADQDGSNPYSRG